MQPARAKLILIGSLFACLLFGLAATPAFAQDQTTVVQPGENLFRIALRYGVDITVLAQANGITNTAQIYAGQTLVIPTGNYVPVQPAQPAVNVSAPANPVYHTVQRGERLVNIAQQYGLTLEQLVQINNLANPNLIFSGQQLLVSLNAPEPSVAAPVAVVAAAPVETSGQQSYVVQPGEHLASIAERFGVSWPAIAQANNMADPNQLFAGQTLIIPAPGSTAVGDYGIVTAPAYNAQAAPAPVVAVGKSIVVDLSDSRTYAYENGQLVRNVLVSTGLPGTPTVVGDFNIYVKYVSTLMVGPGYYLPDVPYTMYFYEGYGLHGTYWHNNFGNPMSHGCVNLPTPEAEWFFNWAPVGTPVHVEY